MWTKSENSTLFGQPDDRVRQTAPRAIEALRSEADEAERRSEELVKQAEDWRHSVGMGWARSAEMSETGGEDRRRSQDGYQPSFFQKEDDSVGWSDFRGLLDARSDSVGPDSGEKNECPDERAPVSCFSFSRAAS